MTKRLPRLGTLALLAGMAPAAFAQLPECGIYRDQVTQLHIDILNDGEAVEYQLDDAGHSINRMPLLIGIQDERAYAMSAEFGGLPERTQFTLSEDGSHILRNDGPGRDFARVRRKACQASDLPPPGPCRGNLANCMRMLRDAQQPTLSYKAACDEGVAHACIRWVEALQLDAAGIASEERNWLRPSKAELDVVVDPPALDSATLDQLPALCEQHGAINTCETMGDALWRGLRVPEALAAWRRGCQDRGQLSVSSLVCDGYQKLQARLGEQARPIAAEALPCGTYHGDVWSLDFGANGLVTFNEGEIHRGVIDDGDVLFPSLQNLRLRPLANGGLIGLNGIILQDVLQPNDSSGCAKSDP